MVRAYVAVDDLFIDLVLVVNGGYAFEQPAIDSFVVPEHSSNVRVANNVAKRSGAVEVDVSEALVVKNSKALGNDVRTAIRTDGSDSAYVTAAHEVER